MSVTRGRAKPQPPTPGHHPPAELQGMPSRQPTLTYVEGTFSYSYFCSCCRGEQAPGKGIKVLATWSELDRKLEDHGALCMRCGAGLGVTLSVPYGAPPWGRRSHQRKRRPPYTTEYAYMASVRSILCES